MSGLALPHRADAVVRPPVNIFVDVTLVADVEDKFVLGRFKNAVQRMVNSTTPRFGPRWPPVCDKDLYEFVAHLLR